MLTDSLSRLRCLGLYEDNDTEGSEYEYGKLLFDIDEMQHVALTVIKMKTNLKLMALNTA